MDTNITNITRDFCKNITENTDAFYVTETNVQGYKVEMYNYRLAGYTDFIDNNALELRGITFILNEDNVWERHLALEKFFNCNQTEDWLQEDLEKLDVRSIQTKLDGSMITFVKLPNGNIVAKTKMSFVSEQAITAYDIFSKTNLSEFVIEMLNKNYTPIFELTSPFNQIVVSYDNVELRLLQVRDENGILIDDISKYKEEFNVGLSEYYDLDKITRISNTLSKETVIKHIEGKKFNSLDSFIDALDAIEEKDTDKLLTVLELILISKEYVTTEEGVVITFKGGKTAKIKNNWYLSLHGLITEATRENLLVKTIIEDNIDDVIAEITEGDKKDFIVKTTKLVTKDFNAKVVDFKKLRGDFFNKYNSDKKKFALANKHKEMFGLVMRTKDTSFRDIEKVAEDEVRKYILSKTLKLEPARKYLKDLNDA